VAAPQSLHLLDRDLPQRGGKARATADVEVQRLRRRGARAATGAAQRRVDAGEECALAAQEVERRAALAAGLFEQEQAEADEERRALDAEAEGGPGVARPRRGQRGEHAAPETAEQVGGVVEDPPVEGPAPLFVTVAVVLGGNA